MNSCNPLVKSFVYGGVFLVARVFIRVLVVRVKPAKIHYEGRRGVGKVDLF